MLPFLKNLPVRLKLLFIISVLVVVFLGGLAILHETIKKNEMDRIEQELQSSTRLITDMVETAADVAIRNYLRAAAQANLEIIKSIYNNYLAGNITEIEAQKEAKHHLIEQRIGKSGYIYCLDSLGKVVVHPLAGVQDTDVSDISFIREQLSIKSGYLEYTWKNPGEVEPRAKALSMAYFEPWDWIISVSAYRNEFSELVSIKDFQKRINGIKFGKSGYAYILNTKGKILLHPFLNDTPFEAQPLEERQLIQQHLQEPSGRILYSWKNPTDSNPRDKIVFFNRIDEYGWIIGSSAYIDEFQQPVTQIRGLFFLALAGALLIAFPLAVSLSNSVTNPLERLIATLGESNGSHTVARMDWDSKDEIGTLARHFNNFMDRIENSAKELENEIKERKNAERQLLLYKEVFENASEGISITDPNGTMIAINPAFTRITGYKEAEALGHPPSLLKSDRHDPDFYARMWQALKREGEWSGEVWNRRKNGEVYPEWLSISSILDEKGKTSYYVAVFHDVTDMKSQEDQIRFLAYHDALTRLPNRTLLIDRLDMAISHAKRHQNRLALLFLDLDNFKHVNDSLGHALGDLMLVEFVERINRLVRDTDTLSRLGGDEFVILVENIINETEAVYLAERVMQSLSLPFHLEGREVYATASIGITIYPEDGVTSNDLLKNADAAMYWAKDLGKNRYHLYTDEMNKRVTKRLQMEADIRRGLERDEFMVHFQPRINLEDGKMVGMEALARWQKPNGTFSAPYEFIPLAEEIGLIIPLGLIVLKKALLATQELHEQGHRIKVSVNLSPRQFQHPDLLERVEEILQETGFSPEYLEFEITETVIMQHLETSLGNLHRLSRRGIKLAIDDFGTGYSSLYYLKRLPIDILKIDRSFIKDVIDDPSDAKLVETIILLARNFDLKIIAEGVETEAQLNFLKNQGCHEVQGFYYSKPLPFAELITYLHSR